jgi:hypothetical protein
MVSRMGVGNSGSRRIGALVVALVAIAALAVALATSAGAAKLVGKNGQVYACYKAKGKHKGAVHLVAKKGKCRKGEQKVSWNSVGPQGKSGENGENGSNGSNGVGGESGTNGVAGTPGLEKQVNQLTSKVTELEGVLKGVTNGELLGALTKLQGISPTQLQEAVASVTKVNSLCSQTSKLTSQSNALSETIGGLKLLNVLPGVELEKSVPLPTPLSAFACP